MNKEEDHHNVPRFMSKDGSRPWRSCVPGPKAHTPSRIYKPIMMQNQEEALPEVRKLDGPNIMITDLSDEIHTVRSGILSEREP